MAITSSDIAKLAGVSRSAVSAVLNGHYNKVSLAKREKILSIAHDFHYRPNQAALILAKKAVRKVGIITSPFMSSLYSDLVSKLAFLLKERNYSSSIVLPVDAADELEAILDMDSSGVEGIIVAYALNDIRKITTKAPVVSMSPYPGQYELRVDLRHSFQLAVEHLKGHGHAEVGMLCPKLSVVPLQHKGYLDAIGSAPPHILEVTENKSFAAELRQMVEKQNVRAWTVTNDLLAAKFMKFLLRQGCRVPEDVAVIGFDGAPLAEITPCPLTTVIFPASAIAARCVEMLFEKIASKDNSFRKPPELIRPELYIGESCGCPPHGRNTMVWDGQRISLDGDLHS
ncbi:MAG: Ribose operon repressor [Lentisphaerae bacterium ADurb.Bin242]|nr:MAG: Ribose operon repressor [Lentisphaerae bacterium ADurb.Bin242]